MQVVEVVLAVIVIHIPLKILVVVVQLKHL